MTIDGTLKLIQENNVSIGDVISVFISIIALIGVVYSTRKTEKSNKLNAVKRNEFENSQRQILQKHEEKLNNNNLKIQEEIEKDNRLFQENLQQTKIAADLKSKARIEWIQKARVVSADLITNAFKLDILIKNYLNLTRRVNSMRDKKEDQINKELFDLLIEKRSDIFKELQETFDLTYEKQTLFKLYFGPNEENDRIVEQSLRVSETAEVILENILAYRFNLDEKKGIEMYKGLKGYEDGENKLARIDKTIDGIIIKEIDNKSLKKEIELFSDSARAYFKKEWDIAKAGN